MPADDAHEIERIGTGDGADIALEAATVLTAAVPALGGPISAIISGQLGRRNMRRIAHVLSALRAELEGQQDRINTDYVKTEEFEELLEQTLLRVRNERIEAKRNIYAAFLADATSGAGGSYDEQLQFIKTIENLQEAHIAVLTAFMAKPDEKRSDYPGGSVMQTLRRRLPRMSEGRIEDLVRQLNELHVTKVSSLRGMMSAWGAENLSSRITSYGMRLLTYIRA